jgi:hypothetical protein
MEDPLEIIALGVARIETEVGSLRAEVRHGFARTESRLDNIERKLDRHEVRIEALEEKTK